jgi:TolA-binding protein
MCILTRQRRNSIKRRHDEVPVHAVAGRTRRRVAAVCLLSAGAALGFGQEVSVDAEQFKRLDTFESHTLVKADQAFGQGQYRQAASEYEAFNLQFPKSTVAAYAVFRRARSLQLDGKRFEAMKAYREVLDYFPNDVAYAAPAIYFIGECHAANGDIKEAVKAWIEMAADEEYAKHQLAAAALNRLADNLMLQGKTAEGLSYYRQVATTFRKSNLDQAGYAINKIVYHYVRTQPDQAKLREFYDKVGTFERDPGNPEDANYWSRLRGYVVGFGGFDGSQQEEKARYFKYWAPALDGKSKDEGYRLDVANAYLAADKDAAKWEARLDEVFRDGMKDGDYDRIIRWIVMFAGRKAKVDEYYAKLDFGKMTNPAIMSFMRVAFENLNDAEQAKHTCRKLRFDKMSDDEKVGLARYLWDRDAETTMFVYEQLGDKELANAERLRFYHHKRDLAHGLPLADVVIGIPKYSKEAYWLKAELLDWNQKFPEAIAAYNASDRPPDSSWRVAECLARMGKVSEAVAQWTEIENFFPDKAPAAAIRSAYAYRDAKNDAQYVAALRNVMKKYPKSGESNAAHLELERLGVKIGGGVDAE